MYTDYVCPKVLFPGEIQRVPVTRKLNTTFYIFFFKKFGNVVCSLFSRKGTVFKHLILKVILLVANSTEYTPHC